jgi:serine/threonine protein kinase
MMSPEGSVLHQQLHQDGGTRRTDVLTGTDANALCGDSPSSIFDRDNQSPSSLTPPAAKTTTTTMQSNRDFAKSKLSEYNLLDLVGEGSFGKVYKARKKFTGETSAIKFIAKKGKTERDLRSLRQEIDILRVLKHPNIIAMRDAFETENEFCVVMEYAQGELFEVLEDDRTLPELEVKAIARQLVSALHYLHTNRVIHRDMKPQNVLIGANKVVKLCDFGFARSIRSQSMVMTSIKGTPLYMAPELVQEQPYNHTVDLWSLGVILYELFVGKPPFFTNSIYTLIQKIVRDPLTWPEDMSAEFKSFLRGLLNKRPSERLSWPALLEHPFVRKSEYDDEHEHEHEQQQQRGEREAGEHAERRRRVEDVENRMSAGEKTMTTTMTTTHTRRPLASTPQAAMRMTNATTTATINNKTPIVRRGGLPRREDVLAGTTTDGFTTPKMPARRPPPSTTRGAAVAGTTTSTATAGAGVATTIGGTITGTTPRTVTAGDMAQHQAPNTNHVNEKQYAHGIDATLLECELKSRTEDGAARLRRDRTAIKVILAALQPPRSAPGSKFNILALLSPGHEREKGNSSNAESGMDDGPPPGGSSTPVNNANGPTPKLTSSLPDAVSALKTLRNIVCVSSASLAKVGGDASGALARDAPGAALWTVRAIAAMRNPANETKGDREKYFAFEIEREEALQLALNVATLLASASGPSPWCNVGLANYLRALSECLVSFEVRRNIGKSGDDNEVDDNKLRLRLIRSKLETQHFARVAVSRAIDVASKRGEGQECIMALSKLPKPTFCESLIAHLASSFTQLECDLLEEQANNAQRKKDRENDKQRSTSENDNEERERRAIFKRRGEAVGDACDALLKCSSCYAPVSITLVADAFVRYGERMGAFQALIKASSNSTYCGFLSLSGCRIVGACSRASTAFADKALEKDALMRFSTRLIKLVARASELWKGVTPSSSSETKTAITNKLRPVADGIAAVAYALHPLAKENCETAHPADFLCDSGVAESCCDAMEIFSSFSTSIVTTMAVTTPGMEASSKAIEEYKSSQHLAIFSLLNVLRLPLAFIPTKGSNAEKVGAVANRKFMTVLKEKKLVGTLLMCVKSVKTDVEMCALRKYSSYKNDDGEEHVEEEDNKSKSKKNKKAFGVAANDSATAGTSNSSEAQSLSSAISLISRLVITGGDVFGNQFIEAKGCSASLNEFALSQSSFTSSLLNNKQKPIKVEFMNEATTIVDWTMILSQLAKSNENRYENVGEGNPTFHLTKLLRHEDFNVRARAANALGNLCRHSDYFYPSFKKYGTVSALTDRLSADEKEEPSALVRKFAAFAIGNAGFHSDYLYDDLRRSIVHLVRNIGNHYGSTFGGGRKDENDAKTRSNAAAALGNLARNGDALIADLLANDVPKALILLAKEYASDKSSSKKNSSGGSDKQTPAHVALFSLGNLCAHEECRVALIKLGVRNALQQSRTSEDELLRKYALRVLAKLENS